MMQIGSSYSSKYQFTVVVISFLVMAMTIDFISHLVSCFSAIGGVIFYS